ncbi:MAG: hypothetical protein JKX78_12120 [Alteromonadaceae bacterium]|nr:hypothetical protein [Alteromonadaceae bacterium]
MNINSQVSSLPLATVVNPATDSLRRDNSLRELTPPPAATSQSAAEKGLSNRDSSKSAPQNNEQVDFANLKKQAAKANTSVNDQQAQQDNSSGNNKTDSQKEQNSAIDGSSTNSQKQNTSAKGSTQNDAATQEIAQQITSLKRRDQEVKAHESAHAAVGGSVTGAPSFSYKRGPDGKNYAVDGEVSVDVSAVSGDPQATIAKMQKVHAAALAPLNPSAQDKRVAAQAAKNSSAAQSELLNVNLDNANASKKSPAPRVNNSDRLASQQDKNSVKKQTDNADNFDSMINKTLKAQEDIVPTRSKEITQRALRIESFYSNINQAYSKEPSFQFQLTA